MIPIECPKCGREGNIPPDRLNAKLTCRGCQAVFHLDNTGRMVMGPPGDPASEKKRAPVRYAAPSEPINLSQTWAKTPVAVKVAVPIIVIALVGWQALPRSHRGPSYQQSSESVIQALLKNDRTGVVAMSTRSSGESSGKWFDVIRKQLDKAKIAPDTPITPSLFSGNPDKDSSLIMMAVITGDSPSKAPIQLNLHMTREGSNWRFDGDPSLLDAERAVASAKK